MGTEDLPSLNAFLNASAAVLLIFGRAAISNGDRARHKRWMLAATCVSAIFLACYLVYHALHGSTRFVESGWPRVLYFSILTSHTVLAALNVPLIIVTLVYALTNRIPRHKKIAKITWMSWVYVSVTGVLIYAMLYHVWPGERGGVPV